MKSKILLLISMLFIMTACESNFDDKSRSKEEREHISEWREKGYFVIDAYEVTDPKRPLADNTAPIVYDIPAEGDEILLDYRTYSDLGYICSFSFTNESEKTPYERLVYSKIGRHTSKITENIHGIWVFEPRTFEDEAFSVDATDPYKAVIKIGKNESEKNRHLYLNIGWSFINRHHGKYNYSKFQNHDAPESRALPSELISIFNTVIIQQRGTADTDERDLYEELIENPHFPFY